MKFQVLEQSYTSCSRNVEQYKGVLVFAEQHRGNITECTFELLGEGRKLGDKLGEDLMAVLVGFEIESLSDSLFGHGADVVCVTNNKNLELYQTEAYTIALTTAITEYKPSIVLLGATAIGLDLAPRVATRLQTGLIAHAVTLDIEDGSRALLATCPSMGGHVLATIKCSNHRPQMCTVLPGMMSKPDFDSSRKGKIVKFEVGIDPSNVHTKVLEVSKIDRQSNELDHAEIVVAGGRGVGNADNFRLIEELANILSGAVGASKAVTDAGWKPHSCMIGQTGKTIGPRLYIACGISGEIQHVVGIRKADIIVAINKDPEAPIFNVADYGIVGDLREVLPALVRKLKSN